MSKRYKGAILSSTPPTTSASSASGVWTEQQFMQGVATGNWPALPGAPTIGTATAGALSASVTFTAPTYTGSGITGYTVTSSPGSITGTGASSPITVSGLTAGTPYTFTVTATTAAGQSSASAASNSVTPTAPNYIEDVFSTYVYNGGSPPKTITNGIDLSGKGGLTWIKSRNLAESHRLVDTVRGATKALYSNATDAQVTEAAGLTAFTSSGFTVNYDSGYCGNTSTDTYASWTFRKQPKFFDIVTYTGNAATTRQISHNLGSVPGCIFIKATSGTSNWFTYHRGNGTTTYTAFELNSTSNSTAAAATTPTSTYFDVQSILDSGYSYANDNGVTYVAYLFAHNAGGFGLTGTDNVISCGSVSVTSGSGTTNVNLGYEPQWILTKISNQSGYNWAIYDTMRGWVATTGGNYNRRLNPNTSTQETSDQQFQPNATGFQCNNSAVYTGSQTDIIYIAIRRGPMKVPTDATKVFTAITRNGTSANATVTGANFPPDLVFPDVYNVGGTGAATFNRLIGPNKYCVTYSTAAEVTETASLLSYDMTGFSVGADNTGNGQINLSGNSYVNWLFGRAPSFFDEVCYTGNGSDQTLTHNLGIAPELMIVKTRSAVSNFGWYVYAPGLAGNLILNRDWSVADFGPATIVSTPTTTTFNVAATYGSTSGVTYVSYLFATCAGVSKVGSYTGNGTTQTINCGFGAGGARFVLIKRTDATGGWYVYDTARGMTTLTDPYLLLNGNNAQTATLGSVTTVSTGFAVNASILAAINTNAASYIFLAIA